MKPFRFMSSTNLYGYAQQKFYEALYSLVGHSSIAMRLTYAAEYLLILKPSDLPDDMRADSEQLMQVLLRESLGDSVGFRPRKLDELEADRCAQKILSMYTQLLGGLQ